MVPQTFLKVSKKYNKLATINKGFPGTDKR